MWKDPYRRAELVEKYNELFNSTRPREYDEMCIRDRWMLMMLYSPGTRTGLIAELQTMQKSLTGRDRNLRRWTASLLAKLAEMTDAEYEALDLYPDE